ncbi:DUF4085 family protein [Aquibacillus rhizosphaerae]|uniref:DUF4085 family protein n=1 Tax=Aquibacillus rhizosphaerae TaxID=3051431 RepID=A0ABT7L538_9BACI|nr:DUF4085 family protein [Aquibacillus sp. LR5S19]MDL4840983.1 DUF4085 family protein [Aquibacillus sp. LR5S19]
MWHISKEAKVKFNECNFFPIYESDEEWEMVFREAKEDGEDLYSNLNEELEEVREELLRILPHRFFPYIENGTLNKPTLPKAVREDYLEWMREADKAFEKILDAANDQTMKALPYLPTSVKDVFEESLHDSTIQRIIRDGDTLHLYVNTDDGFSSKSLIHFVFRNIVWEETDQPLVQGQWFIYYELQKTDEGFAFRVLFECPEAEWTITMKKLDATYYYHPGFYVKLRDEDKLEQTSLEEYVDQLNKDQHYWFITPHVTAVIQSFTGGIQLENGKVMIGKSEIVVTVGDEQYNYDLEENNPLSFIYTDVFEDPYASLNEPVPTEQLEMATRSDELELQVRAWNTMYANPEELADITNRVLWNMEITEDNEMMLYVYINHFYEKGILTEAVIGKYQKLIE